MPPAALRNVLAFKAMLALNKRQSMPVSHRESSQPSHQYIHYTQRPPSPLDCLSRLVARTGRHCACVKRKEGGSAGVVKSEIRALRPNRRHPRSGAISRCGVMSVHYDVYAVLSCCGREASVGYRRVARGSAIDGILLIHVTRSPCLLFCSLSLPRSSESV